MKISVTKGNELEYTLILMPQMFDVIVNENVRNKGNELEYTLILIPQIFDVIVNVNVRNKRNKASVTILAGFSQEFDPPFLWCSKHQTKKMIMYINNLVPSEFPNRSSRSARSFTSTLICT